MTTPPAAAPGAVASLPPATSLPHRRPVLTLYSLPLPLGRRLRLTSLAVSPSLLVLGTNSGSLYFYARPTSFPPPSLSSLSPPLSSPLASRALSLPPPSFLRLVTLELPPSSSSSLLQLQLSPYHPHLLAVTTAASLLLLHCNPLVPSLAHRVLHSFSLSSPPTCLSFSPEDALKRCVLYCGDEGGVVHRLSLPFPHSVMHRPSVESVLRLEPPLVQLTALPSHLLLSTPARSYVCPYSPAKAEMRVVPIGSKARSAAYTVCVDPSAPPTADGPSLLASRPGRRLWKADCCGTVLSTLILQPPPPSAFTPLASLIPLPLPPTFPLSSLNFTHLAPFAHSVVSYTPNCPHLLVIDVGHVCVVDFFVSFHRLLHVQAEGRSLFVLHEREEGGDVELSIVQATSPYSHLQRLLTQADAIRPLPLHALLCTAVKYKVYDRALLTQLQRLVDDNRAGTGTGEELLTEEVLNGFTQLVVEAERCERTCTREEHWDDDGLTASDAVAASTTSALPLPGPPPASTAPVDGATAPITSLLSSSARRVLSKLTAPSLTSSKDKDRAEAEATALPASPKPSLLERTTALLTSSSTPPVAPSPPHPPAADRTVEAALSTVPPPTNPFQLSATHPRSNVGSGSGPSSPLMVASSTSEEPSTPSSSDSAPDLSSPTAEAQSNPSPPADSAAASSPVPLPLPVADVEAFSRASLLPAENLPFAEPQVEVGLEGERKAAVWGGGERRKRRPVVDVSGEGEEAARRERERKRREKREAERRRLEREKKARQSSAAPLPVEAAEAATSASLPPQVDDVAVVAAAAPPAATPPLSMDEEEKTPPSEVVDDGAEHSGGAAEEKEVGQETKEKALPVAEGVDEDEGADDEVSVLLRPSSFSLLCSLRDSPLSSLRPLLRSMRWALTTASIFCRENSTPFTPIEGEEVVTCRQRRWTAAQEPSLPYEGRLVSLDGLIDGWVDRFWAEVEAATAFDDDNETEEEGNENGDRMAALKASLLTAPPLLLQELSSLLLLRLHLLVLSAAAAPPASDGVADFIGRFHSLLDPVLAFSYLRHYHHPLCFTLHRLFHLPLPPLSTSSPLPSNPLLLAASLSSLLASPSAALALHLADSFPHVEPWMVTRVLSVDADTQPTALALPSPLPLVPALHSLGPTDGAGGVQVRQVAVSLNFYRAYLDCLLCRLPYSALLSPPRRDGDTWRQWLYLTLRLGMPTSPPPGAIPTSASHAAQPSQWPFFSSIESVMYGRVECPIGVEELCAVLESVGCVVALPALFRRRVRDCPSVAVFVSALRLSLQVDDLPSALLLLDDLSASSLSLHSRLSYAKAALDSFADRWTTQPPMAEEGRLFHAALHSLLLALGPPLLLQLLLALPADSPLLSQLPLSFPSFLLSHSQSLFSLSRTSLALLETVDSALWAERVDSLSPQIRAIALHEMEVGWIHKLTHNTPHATLTQPSHGSHVVSHTAPWSRWGEDGGGGDWGRRVSAEGLRCGCCGVTIDWSSVRGGGGDEDAVVGFECDGRHVYHRRCLPELACVLCLGHRMSAAGKALTTVGEVSHLP